MKSEWLVNMKYMISELKDCKFKEVSTTPVLKTASIKLDKEDE